MNEILLAVYLTVAVACIVVGVSCWSTGAGWVTAGVGVGALGVVFFAGGDR